MGKYPFVGKCFAVGIILIFIGTNIVPIIAQTPEKQPIPTSGGNWLYVGGSGPGNYSKIQDAINASNPFDTVFVYSGHYNELIKIEHPLKLIGESKDSTFITSHYSHGQDLDNLITLVNQSIQVSGFTLCFEGDPEEYLFSSVIHCHYCWNAPNTDISGNNIYANNSTGIFLGINDDSKISNNSFFITNGTCMQLLWWDASLISDNHIVLNNSTGITIYEGRHSHLSNNIITGDGKGFGINFGDDPDYSSNLSIINNTFFNLSNAVCIQDSADNTIAFNSIDNPTSMSIPNSGIHTTKSFNDSINGNSINHCNFGVFLNGSQNTRIIKNIFKKNTVNARFNQDCGTTFWNRNYWGRPRILPVPILGVKNIYQKHPGFFEFDWHPALLPYDIPGGAS